jgi:tetratricopeptide (TPR) repeat protein
MERALPGLGWRTHIFILGEPEPPRELVDGVLERAGAHLDRIRFANLAVHPRVDLDRGSWFEAADFDRLLEPMKRFQEEGYREQGESRLLVHPILTTRGETPTRRVVDVVADLRSRLAFPRVVISERAAPALLRSLDSETTRVHIEAPGDPGSDSVLGHLGAHHVFESLIGRTGDDVVLAPCNRHLVVDPSRGGVFPCFHGWREGSGALPLDGPLPGPETVPDSACAGCMARSMGSVRTDLEHGGRHAEGHRVMLGLAIALGGRNLYDAAAELAGHAAELAIAAAERAAARLHRGLCYLHAGRLEEADQALLSAREDGADPGLIAFHRGRVQMAWPDEIEALERFDEAIAAVSEHVPVDELHLLMAMCHVNLAEHGDARPHLDQVTDRSQLSVVEFYRGLCELGQSRAERALVHFGASLAAGPEDDDLSRVLLYLSTSLKELDRFEEAVEPLERAVALEPGESAHHNLLGYCLYKLGRHDEAVASFEKAVEIDPRSALDWSNLGANLRELGRLDEAETAYKKALALDPTLTLATNGLARVDQLRRGGE